MAKTIQKRDNEIDKLTEEVRAITSPHDKNESTGFFFSQNQLNRDRILNLVRMATQFLVSMKTLQKAVHRREPDIQREKSDFDKIKKDLEHHLRNLKRTLDDEEEESKRFDQTQNVQKF